METKANCFNQMDVNYTLVLWMTQPCHLAKALNTKTIVKHRSNRKEDIKMEGSKGKAPISKKTATNSKKATTMRTTSKKAMAPSTNPMGLCCTKVNSQMEHLMEMEFSTIKQERLLLKATLEMVM